MYFGASPEVTTPLLYWRPINANKKRKKELFLGAKQIYIVYLPTLHPINFLNSFSPLTFNQILINQV